VGTIHRPPPYQDGALPLSYTRCYGSPTRPRTADLLVNSQALLPTELPGNGLGSWIRTSEGVKPADLQTAAFDHLAIPRWKNWRARTESNRGNRVWSPVLCQLSYMPSNLVGADGLLASLGLRPAAEAASNAAR
jgi:hypothetical protein